MYIIIAVLGNTIEKFQCLLNPMVAHCGFLDDEKLNFLYMVYILQRKENIMAV